MKPSFEKNLREFSKLSKEEAVASDGAEIEKLQTVVDHHLERASKSQGTENEAQEEIFEIQKQKQAIMERLHENLRCLDDAECSPERAPESRLVTYDEKNGGFFVEMPDGTQEKATLGDVLTDGDWGLEYYLDPESAPRGVQKKFFVESAKRELRGLLDEQILVGTKGSDKVWWRIKKGMSGAFEGHSKIKEFVDSPEKLKESGNSQFIGFIGELLIKNFLKQLQLNDQLDFEIEEADIYQDVQEKIDFIIHVKKHKRGVDVEATDELSDVGVQFTISRQEDRINKKQKQVKKAKGKLAESGTVDDIVLVQVPIKALRDYFVEWAESGALPGGPISRISVGLRKHLLEKVLENIPALPEIENLDDIEQSMVVHINKDKLPGKGKTTKREFIREYKRALHAEHEKSTHFHFKILEEEQVEEKKFNIKGGWFLDGELVAEGEATVEEKAGKPKKAEVIRKQAIARAKKHATNRFVEKIKEDPRVKFV